MSPALERTTGIFVDGIGTAAATSGVLTQLQGRIFALLYLHRGPLSLEEIAARLGQSKSNVSVQMRGLAEWHLVRHTRLPGSRKDHYEAATDFWRVMQEIMERRFRWNLRQVLGAVEETRRALANGQGVGREDAAFLEARLGALGAFFTAVDFGLGAFVQGKAVTPEGMQKVVPLPAASPRRRT
jgi:DNA-binding transcriptional regulator GbsR (MarR family)